MFSPEAGPSRYGPQTSPLVQALEDQIKGDFAKVTGFGDKAGFLPPVKVPHM